MRLANIRDRFITLELLPEDCIVLATACDAAFFDLETAKDTRLGALLLVFTTALEAAAMAAGEDTTPMRSLARFRRENASHYPDGEPPAVRDELPPTSSTPSLVPLAAD